MVQKAKNTAAKSLDIPVGEQAPETEKLVVTQAKDWNKSNTDERLLELPSGAVFKVRNVSLPNMVTKGIIPLNVTTQLLAMKKNIESAVKNGKGEADGMGKSDFNEIDRICRQFTLLSVIEPTIVEESTGSPNEICVNDIDFMDMLHIFTKCMRGGADQFRSFF